MSHVNESDILSDNTKMEKQKEGDTLIDKIAYLKEQKNAVILAHYYVNEEVQKIADYVGDSYYLSKIAKEEKADRIIFCGVSFMGESAKLLNPKKHVHMPDLTADCAMAHMAQKEKIAEMRAKYKNLAVVCYINSTVELKAYSDVCVTSSNAEKIVRNLPNQNIFFIPDGNLGHYIANQVPEKNIILNEGYCPVHAAFTAEKVRQVKSEHPKAEFIAHPECPENVLKEADYIGSTSEIIQYATESKIEEFIVGTETGVFYELREKNPNKKFYQVTGEQVCMDMKKITLEKVAEVLANESNEIFVDQEIHEKALRPLERMLELAK